MGKHFHKIIDIFFVVSPENGLLAILWLENLDILLVSFIFKLSNQFQSKLLVERFYNFSEFFFKISLNVGNGGL